MKAALLAALAALLAGCETTHPGETPEQRAARQQQGLQMMMFGSSLMRPAPIAPLAPLAPPTVCNTRRAGGGYQTICQ